MKERHSAKFPKGKPTATLRGTDFQVDILDLAQRHPCLPTYYFYAHFGKYEYTRKAIRQIFKARAAGLPLGHGEFGISRAARHYCTWPKVHYPVQVWPIGKDLLIEKGRWLGFPAVNGNEFDHNVLTSIASYSLTSAPRPHDITLRTQADILADARCPERTRALERPERVEFGKKDAFVPDYQLFGYQRLQPNGKTRSMYFHGFELDRNTETYETIRHKLRQYVRYLSGGYFEALYGFKNAPTILFITTNRSRADGILRLIAKEVPKSLQDRFAVKVISDFRTKLPPATSFLVTEPWERVGEPLNIPRLLGVTDGQDTSRENSRANGNHQESGGGNREAPRRRAPRPAA